MNEENFDPWKCINPYFLSWLEQKWENLYLIYNYMSNINLISLERLQNALDHMDWNLCFICQQNERQNLQNPEDKKGKQNSKQS